MTAIQVKRIWSVLQEAPETALQDAVENLTWIRAAVDDNTARARFCTRCLEAVHAELQRRYQQEEAEAHG